MSEPRFADETRQPLYLLTVLVTLILLAYANTLFSPFNFDDEVVLNQELPQSGDRYQKIWPPQYRHLFFASLKMNQDWQAENPFGYHLFNLTLHVLTSVTIFCIAWFTFKYAFQSRKRSASAMAFLCSALFAMHPLHTEAVTYISGRASSLAGLFYFLSLLCFICGSLKQNKSKILRLLYFLLTLIMFVLSIFSKETALSLPLVLIAYDICLMKNQHWIGFKERLIFLYLPIPLFALVFILKSPLFITLIIDWMKKIEPTYAIKQIGVLAYSISLEMFPINLVFDYDFPEAFFTLGMIPVALTLVFLIMLILWTSQMPKGKAVILFCGLWFLITLAPTNSILPRADLLSERNLYLPVFAWSLFLSIFIYQLFQQTRTSRTVRITLISILLLLSLSLLIDRNSTYRSETLLWEDTFKKSPGQLRALHNLSHFYLEKKQHEKAFVALKQLAESNASSFYLAFAHSNLGSLYIEKKQPALAKKAFEESIRQDTSNPTGYLNLGSIYAAKGEFEKARAEYEKAEERYRIYTWGYKKPKELTFNLAKVNFKLGLWSDAEKKTLEYLQNKPGAPEGHLLLGRIYAATRKMDQALQQYKLTQGNPLLQAEANNNRGVIMIQQNRLNEAQKLFENALTLNSDMPDAHFNLAFLLLQTGGDSSQIKSHLQAAIQLTDDPAKKKTVQQLLENLKKTSKN